MSGYIHSPVSLEKGVRSLFLSMISDSIPDYVELLATQVPSDSDMEKYGWLGQLPKVREWIDQREIKDLKDADYTVVNRDWEASLGIDRNDLEDDKLSAVPMRISQLVDEAGTHPAELAADTLIKGTDATLNGKATSYDGGAFFRTDHPARNQEGGTQSNLQTGTGTTVAAVRADYATARAAMTQIKTEGGKIFLRSIKKPLIICHPDMLFTFQEAFGAELISNTSNILKGEGVTIVQMPELTDVNDWYLAEIGRVLKPMLFQLRKGIQLETLKEGSEVTFMQRKYRFGTHARYAMAFTLWQLMRKVTNT